MVPAHGPRAATKPALVTALDHLRTMRGRSAQTPDGITESVTDARTGPGRSASKPPAHEPRCAVPGRCWRAHRALPRAFVRTDERAIWAE